MAVFYLLGAAQPESANALSVLARLGDMARVDGDSLPAAGLPRAVAELKVETDPIEKL